MKITQINKSSIFFKSKKCSFNCNQKDKNGVTIFEKVIKSEKKEFLPYFYLTDNEIVFNKGMLDAFNNIKNTNFKNELEKSDKIFMRFPELEKAIKEGDLNGIRKGLKTLSQCKFCNRFHAIYLLAATLLKEYDSLENNFSRSIEFIKSTEKFMPEIFRQFYTRFSDTQTYILTIKKIIKNPNLLKEIKF
jgi:hypothetical protein